ncbi:MAG: P-loop NTPase fold protein [Allorhizobium sp.]
MDSNNHWNKDLLERQKDSAFLIDFLKRRHAERKKAGIRGAYVLNVNAEWGFGKSYFLRGMAQDLRKSHPVVTIDAWKNDFSDDPYTMVISEINATVSELIPNGGSEQVTVAHRSLEAVKQNAGKILLAGAKGATKKLVTKLIGDGFDEIADLIAQSEARDEEPEHKDAFTEATAAGLDAFKQGVADVSGELLDALASRMINDYQEVKTGQEQFRSSLSHLLKAVNEIGSVQLPMFIFIDELDRCRPPYAIALLERIKHLFDVEDIVFVVATDTKQLSHTVTGYYGANFDSHSYLHRFFTRTYSLPIPSTHDFIGAMIISASVDTSKWHSIGMEGNEIGFLAQMSDLLGVGLREIQRAMEILFDLSTSWKNSYPIELCIMYPLIIGYLRAQDQPESSKLNEWMAAVEKKIANWKVGEAYVDHFNNRRSDPPSMSELFRAMWSVREKDFYEYRQSLGNSRSQVHSRATDLAYEALSREYSARFNNLVRKGESSCIDTYIKMIRYAGNFS